MGYVPEHRLFGFWKNLYRTYIHNSQYDVWVAGVSVTRVNKDDILGNGTVSYNPSTKTLIFDNAVIECEGSAVAAEENINHDISIVGDGSLTLEIQNISDSAQGIVADDLTISADITITTGNCENILNGIVIMNVSGVAALAIIHKVSAVLFVVGLVVLFVHKLVTAKKA